MFSLVIIAVVRVPSILECLAVVATLMTLIRAERRRGAGDAPVIHGEGDGLAGVGEDRDRLAGVLRERQSLVRFTFAALLWMSFLACMSAVSAVFAATTILSDTLGLSGDPLSAWGLLPLFKTVLFLVCFCTLIIFSAQQFLRPPSAFTSRSAR